MISFRVRRLSLIAGFIAFCLPLVAAAQVLSDGQATGSAASAAGTYERALVERVDASSQSDSSGATQQVEVYHLRFLSGAFKNQTRDVVGEVGSNPYGLQPRAGDKVVVHIQPAADGSPAFFLESYDRRAAVIALVVLFLLTLIGLMGWQGVKVAFSIGLSLVLIGWVLIPAFLRGLNPVPIAILLGGLLTLLSAGLSTGWNRKSLVTAIGTMGGALVAYIISLFFARWAHLNGLSSEEDRLFFDKNPLLNPEGLLFAGIIIAAVGVVEDVAVSIASGVSEVKRANPQASLHELFVSGMVVGKDHMAALANTLLFAYVGGALSTLLLYQQFGSSWLKFMNFDNVVDEVIRSLAGTIGLVFTVPITAWLSALVMFKSKMTDEPGVVSHVHVHHHT